MAETDEIAAVRRVHAPARYAALCQEAGLVPKDCPQQDDLEQAADAAAAQQAGYHQARCNSAARRGKYNAVMEDDMKSAAPPPIYRSREQAPAGE